MGREATAAPCLWDSPAYQDSVMGADKSAAYGHAQTEELSLLPATNRSVGTLKLAIFLLPIKKLLKPGLSKLKLSNAACALVAVVGKSNLC